jgi:DNA-binding HxlR family transcriptional regulator
MKRSQSELCPQVEAAFSLLAKKWTGLILFSLIRGELRFSEIEVAIPRMSARLLSLRMKELERESLVERRVRADKMPIVVSYRLTDRGSLLAAILSKIADWAKK